jgi:hypothetical protein
LRNKTILIICIAFLLLGTSGTGIPTAISPELKAMNHDAMDGNNSNSFSGNSFHGNTTSDNANWYVIKLSSSSPFHLEEINISYDRLLQKTRRDVWIFIFTNFHGENYGHGFVSSYTNPEDRFTHFNIGPINYTNNHLKYWEDDSEGGSWMKWYGITTAFPSGDWYLICIAAPTITCRWSVWINTTEEVEFAGTTEGNDSFIYGAEDFIGNLNIMGPWMLITINGEKRIKVDNTLVACFYTPPGGGLLKYQYIDPEGNKKTYLAWDFSLFRLTIPFKMDFNVDSSIITGSSGEWTFKMGLFDWIYIGYPKIPPPIRDTGLWGADVKLP